MQELVELCRIDAHDGLFTRDEALLHHVHGHLQCRSRRTLAHAGLQHPQRALLDGELDVAHVAVGLLECLEDLPQLCTRLGEGLGKISERLGHADSRHDILSLRILEEVAVVLVRPVGRIARECHTRRARLALVAEDHRLHIDRSPEIIRNLLHLAVVDRAAVVPASEHGLYGQTQLLGSILREDDFPALGKLGIFRSRYVLGDNRLECRDHRAHVFG